MPTHPYYVELEHYLFAELRVVRERARTHKLTIRTRGTDTQPKTFVLSRRGTPILETSDNSLFEIEWYLDRLEANL